MLSPCCFEGDAAVKVASFVLHHRAGVVASYILAGKTTKCLASPSSSVLAYSL